MSWELDGRLLDVLAALEVSWERVEQGAYLVHLRGRRRPSTLVWLIAGDHGVTVEAFVFHVLASAQTDALHARLLRRNRLLRGVHFCLDDVGDVFLTGQLAQVDEQAVDRVLGEVWQVLEDEQEALLQLAYGEQLREEAVAAKVLADGAGRRPAGTPEWAVRRDVRR